MLGDIDFVKYDGDTTNLAKFGISSFHFLLPIGRELSGRDFSVEILSTYNNDRALKVASAIGECVKSITKTRVGDISVEYR